jgi:hypothetical protein
MSAIQLMTLGSAGLGFAGTVFLFLGTYGFEPREGAVFGGPTVDEGNKKVNARNARRRLNQRIGLGLLCLSFLLQGVTAFVS